MNLLQLILIALALIVGGSVFFIAWELTSGDPAEGGEEDPDETNKA